MELMGRKPPAMAKRYRRLWPRLKRQVLGMLDDSTELGDKGAEQQWCSSAARVCPGMSPDIPKRPSETETLLSRAIGEGRKSLE